ncbi:MAG TPA: hypothetical protein PLU87_08245 [Sedimentisphaerales bacterium]|nr:hypothetical protein [Sedimentisphaerales bacterium]HRS10849.1 hypothetical protein [Sedimentisphaerales bacterium]HRV47554.1 hypothetical protein [Sedimentisphaerales bacterium]
MYRSQIESDCGNAAPATHRALLLAVVLASATLHGGCQSAQDANGMAGSFYLNPYKDLNNLGRVALVELDNNSGHPQISADLTEALFVALQKKQVFGLTIVRQDNPDWRGLQGNLDSLQAMRQLLAMRETLKCNGLLVGTVTEYTPYPHMSLGLRLKLLDLTDGQLIWGLEQVWDSSDRNIQKRIKHYFKDDLRTGFASLREELVVVSPLKFGKFVAYEVAETLERQEQ